MENKEIMIRTESLCREFRNGGAVVRAVNNVSLTVRQGELTILRGRSGSGKTTLLNLLSTLDAPTSGRIYYRDQDLLAWSEAEKNRFRREEAGIIFQSVALMSQMTAYENVEFGLRIAGIPRRDFKTLAQKYLNLVGLGNRMTHLPGELSGGEQQRIAIARAIAHQPRLIFADEPTAQLDTATALQVVKLLKELIESEQLTVVMTTHDPNMMEIADTVYSLQDGEIVDERHN